jgi:hypothetical protein
LGAGAGFASFETRGSAAPHDEPFAIRISGAPQNQGGDVASRREVRSITAEAAAVFLQDALGRMTALYTRKMADNARKQLQDIDQSAGERDPVLHQMIADAIAALNKGDANALRMIAERLFDLAGPHGPDR